MTHLIYFVTSVFLATFLNNVVLAATLSASPPPTPTRQPCGGFRRPQIPCPGKQICVDDPYVGGCGMKCDGPGICIEPKFCGGIATFKCDGMCILDPRGSCDPAKGGRDCSGVCVPPPAKNAP